MSNRWARSGQGGTNRRDLVFEILDRLHRFQEHRQQDCFERHRSGGVARDGGVVTRGGKEAVERGTILRAERAAGRRPALFLALNDLRHRGNGAAHRYAPLWSSSKFLDPPAKGAVRPEGKRPFPP